MLYLSCSINLTFIVICDIMPYHRRTLLRMSMRNLSPSEQVRYEETKAKKIANLKKIKIMSSINRLVGIACVFPSLYAFACLGQNKPTPIISKVCTVGFVISIANAGALNKKEERVTSDLYRLADQYNQRSQ